MQSGAALGGLQRMGCGNESFPPLLPHFPSLPFSYCAFICTFYDFYGVFSCFASYIQACTSCEAYRVGAHTLMPSLGRLRLLLHTLVLCYKIFSTTNVTHSYSLQLKTNGNVFGNKHHVGCISHIYCIIICSEGEKA